MKRKKKRVAWWSRPKRKLTKREKAARARARSRSRKRRHARRVGARKAWINRAVKHLGVSRAEAVQMWDGRKSLRHDQAITLLQLRR